MPNKEEIMQWITEAIKWHRHDGVLTQLVLLTQLFGYRSWWSGVLAIPASSVSTSTNGTTPVTIFAPTSFTITSIYVISKDTTAANITIKNDANTVATIAKGTTSGTMTGAASLANATFTTANTLTIVSSSAGNATVIIGVSFPTN